MQYKAEKPLERIRYLRMVKYVFAFAWVDAITYFAISAGGYRRIDLLYNTESGVSVDSAQALMRYFLIVFVILIKSQARKSPNLFVGMNYLDLLLFFTIL